MSDNSPLNFKHTMGGVLEIGRLFLNPHEYSFVQFTISLIELDTIDKFSPPESTYVSKDALKCTSYP